MIKNIIILSIFILSSLKIHAQSNAQKLYFISSNPEMHLDEDVYISLLYQLHGDSLYVQDTLTSGKNMLSRFIRVYPEKGITFYYEENLYNTKDNYLLSIDHKNVNKKKFIRKLDEKINPWPISVLLDNEIYFNLNEKLTSEDIKYVGYSASLNIRNISINDFKYSYLNGSPSFPSKDVDKQLFVLNKGDNKLRIPVTRDITKRPSFPIEIPEKYKTAENRRVAAYINNNKIFLLRLSSTDDRKEGMGESLFLIYSKSTDKWMELKVPGNQTRVQGFDNWITGAFAENDSEEKRVSPGYTSRKNIEDIYGPGFDVMAKVSNLYYPGKLFFFNSLNGEYFEIYTGQGDSEVLFVNEGTILYRICDEIYEVPIIGNNKFGKAKLLVKDSRIHNIHWAFTSR
jgi:hypothetical protein